MSDVPQPPGGPAPQDPPPPSFGAPPPVGGPPPAAPYGAYVPQAPPVSAVSDFGRPLADWWKRLLAIIVDVIILIVVGQLLGVLLGQHRFTRALLGLIIGFAYYGFLNGSERGQTVGKMAMRIQVRRETGGAIGVGAALARYAVMFVLTVLCLVPELVDGLWPLWDKKRQTWHDKVVRSVVVDV